MSEVLYGRHENMKVYGVSIVNDSIFPLYEEKIGYGIRHEHPNFSLYQSSNSLDTEVFKSIFMEPNNACVDLQITEDFFCTSYIKLLMQNVKMELKNTIQSYQIVILQKVITKIIYLRKSQKLLEDRISYKMINVSILINLNDNLIPINRHIIIQDTDCLQTAIESLVNRIVLQYKPLLKKKIVNISETTYDLILPNGIGGIFVHEVIGHALEADNFFSIKNQIHHYFQKKICDSSISISDSCNLYTPLHYNFSDDGTKTQDVKLIDSGLIKGILSDKITATSNNIIDTGNGRSSSYEYPSIPRMRNTYLHRGNQSPEKIILDTKSGILINELGAGQFIHQTGDYSFVVNSGILIINGIKTNIVSPFVIRGNVIDSLKKIVSIGNDLSFHAGTCSKLGQTIDVTYGQPTIKLASHRITSITN